MSNEIFKNNNLQKNLILFLKNNFKLIIIFFTILFLSFVAFIVIDIKNKNKNILMSNQYNEANILIKNNNKKKP